MKDLPLFSQGKCSYTDAWTNDTKVFCVAWTKGSEWRRYRQSGGSGEGVEVVFFPESDIALKHGEAIRNFSIWRGTGSSRCSRDGRIGFSWLLAVYLFCRIR
ncbi:hypothetical protein [Cohnella faecalis]|uniref:hypothetical protein n=1 Tax=Cohnella faecalis TaxID=2315694 RepID=UPI0011C220A5|nr:hypothetical protein [Cohnella faecalis]